MDGKTIARRLEALDGLLSGLVRLGTVTDVDAEKRRARVKFQSEGMTSGWLYVLQHSGGGVSIAPDGAHTHRITDSYTGGGSASSVPAHSHPGSVTAFWTPQVNDTVLCLYFPVENADGFILGGVST